MAFEEDGKFNRKKFEETQLPEILARMNNGSEHITHSANKTITIKKFADGTHEFTVSKRDDSAPEEVVAPTGIPESRQLLPAPPAR
jgi:hypothetical protein